jgi:hypothetical protein
METIQLSFFCLKNENEARGKKSVARAEEKAVRVTRLAEFSTIGRLKKIFLKRLFFIKYTQ